MIIGTKKQFSLFDLVNVVIISFFVILCLVPFLHIIAISLSSNAPIISGKVTIYPLELSFDAYTRVLSDISMIRSLIFTIALTVGFTIFSMIMTTMVAYPLTNPKLKGRQTFMYIIIFTMFFSGGLIPEYLLMKSL